MSLYGSFSYTQNSSFRSMVHEELDIRNKTAANQRDPIVLWNILVYVFLPSQIRAISPHFHREPYCM
jgi:hypothetical protein